MEDLIKSFFQIKAQVHSDDVERVESKTPQSLDYKEKIISVILKATLYFLFHNRLKGQGIKCP